MDSVCRTEVMRLATGFVLGQRFAAPSGCEANDSLTDQAIGGGTIAGVHRPTTLNFVEGGLGTG